MLAEALDEPLLTRLIPKLRSLRKTSLSAEADLALALRVAEAEEVLRSGLVVAFLNVTPALEEATKSPDRAQVPTTGVTSTTREVWLP